MGAYEVMATKDYCRDSKEPNVPGIIFAIDVSYPMIKDGVVQLICRNMKELLKKLPRDRHCDNVSECQLPLESGLIKGSSATSRCSHALGLSHTTALSTSTISTRA